MSDSTALENLVKSSKEIASYQSIEELLHWDQRTQMPAKAADYRAEQLTLLSGLIHEKMTCPERGAWLEELGDNSEIDPESDAGINVARLTRQYNKERKVPKELVEELAKTRALAHESWVKARAENRFSHFADHLQRIVELLKEKTDSIGFETCAYDVLLDDYEPDAKSDEIEKVFEALREELVPLIEQVRSSSRQPDQEIVTRKYDVASQKAVGVDAAKAIGFDFEAGRLDVTHHPFCCTVGPSDCRITTRYDEHFFNTAFFGTLHEAGHGLYEQGLRKDQFGLPTGEYCSLGIHESQSRLWENMVGRSLAFWNYYFPKVQQSFPGVLGDVSAVDFFGAVNTVQPSLIRVEADEATYSLHIIIRFELERELFAGQIEVKDLPEAWRSKYQQYLGVSSDTDSDGLLQDVHWCEALFGYFPTYALGSLYAAHFMEAAKQSIGDLHSQFENGSFEPLLGWLREHVHSVGKSRSAIDILKSSAGVDLSHGPMIKYLREKYEKIYEL